MEKINTEEIKASHNIIDIIGQVVDIKKQGSDFLGAAHSTMKEHQVLVSAKGNNSFIVLDAVKVVMSLNLS